MNGSENGQALRGGILPARRRRSPWRWKQGAELANAGTAPEEVDLILVSTISSNVLLPCAACEVQKELGAVKATGFDLGGAACSGFVFAYNTAMAFLASGVYRTVLVIGSETLSNITNWKDRGTCILFGDGAGAAVLKASEGQMYRPVTIPTEQRAALTCESRYTKNWKEIQRRIHT
ncbi:3-oxoacyl-[acyl-carrier-protein] synthase 3 [[Clostridium] hylemonae DSM 15053]|nr:3-oxoacyl-[acyl-carrier-protein] synthase 3 [[Clostridium] hylemonae DSM 15053]